MATTQAANPGPSPAVLGKFEELKGAVDQALAADNLPLAILGFEQLLLIDPGNAAILSNLAKLHYRTGDIGRALARFTEAHAAAPADPDIKQNFLACHGAMGDTLVYQNRFAEGIVHYRQILAYDPQNAGARINLANALEVSGVRAQLSDFMPGFPPTQLGRHVLLTCMPKSGSSFLKEVLCALTGWSEVYLTYAYLQNEQEIYLPNLIRVAAGNTITQQHCRATGPNTQIMQGFGIRPIVLVRKLEDIILSLSDFYDSGAVANTFFGAVWPTLDAAGKYDLIIDQVMPWYAGFYASWERAVTLGRLECLFVTYEEMIADKPGTVGRIAAFLDLGKSADECAAAVAKADADSVKTRFNKGVDGRGAAALTDDQKARLRRLVAAYGDVDLARLGLA